MSRQCGPWAIFCEDPGEVRPNRGFACPFLRFFLLSTLLGTFLGTLGGHCYPMTIATTTQSNPSRTNLTPPLAESDRLVFTVAEAGELLGISRAFAYELVARGELPVIRLGRRRLIPKRALLELVGMDPAASPGSDPITRLVDGPRSDLPSIVQPASLRTFP